MMIRSGSNFSPLNQDQYSVINKASNTTEKAKPSSSPDKDAEEKISLKTRELQKGYETKDRELDQAHAFETQKLQREYRQDKQSLEREYDQKKRSLDISIYA